MNHGSGFLFRQSCDAVGRQIFHRQQRNGQHLFQNIAEQALIEMRRISEIVQGDREREMPYVPVCHADQSCMIRHLLFGDVKIFMAQIPVSEIEIAASECGKRTGILFRTHGNSLFVDGDPHVRNSVRYFSGDMQEGIIECLIPFEMQ